MWCVRFAAPWLFYFMSREECFQNEQGGAFSEGPLTPLVGSGLARELQVEQPEIVVRHRLTSEVAFSL